VFLLVVILRVCSSKCICVCWYVSMCVCMNVRIYMYVINFTLQNTFFLEQYICLHTPSYFSWPPGKQFFKCCYAPLSPHTEFLLHDNARPHNAPIVKTLLGNRNFAAPHHLPYSPDLADLFVPQDKISLKRPAFSNSGINSVCSDKGA
jgi:hypothetical protein